MEIIFKSRQTDVPTRFKQYATAKLNRLEKLDQKAISVDVELSVERNPRQSSQKERVELSGPRLPPRTVSPPSTWPLPSLALGSGAPSVEERTTTGPESAQSRERAVGLREAPGRVAGRAG